jgi:hypothetical protein
MQEFLVLFRNDFRDFEMEEQERAAHMQRWGEWLGKLQQEGVLVKADPLGPEGKTMAGTEKVISDGPFAESKEMVGGFMFCKGNSIDEVIEHCKECPIFEVPSANIEVRPVLPMP